MASQLIVQGNQLIKTNQDMVAGCMGLAGAMQKEERKCQDHNLDDRA